MNASQLPNLITLARLVLVPAFVVALIDGNYVLALALFAIAGVSDGLDGLIAKRFNYQTRLGAILDPAADKILLVSGYVMLAVLGHVPVWLVVVVAFRDLLIVAGYLVYTSMYGPVQMRPSALSKLNTFLQIALVVMVLFEQAASFSIPGAAVTLIYAVFVTTVASGVHYFWMWGVMKDIAPARRPRRHE